MQVASRQCLWKDTISGKDTILEVEIPDSGGTARIGTGTLAPGSSEITVQWGDGQKSVYPKINGATHTYASGGTYLIRISDDMATFGYANGANDAQKDILRQLVSLGSKVTTISSYGFNNCKKMRGVINLPNVTNIGGYAFGTTLGITDFILPSMTRLVQTAFYSGPTPRQIHADNVKQIDSRFWEYYGWKLYDLYLRNSTCAQIKAMSGFPFKADRAAETVRFHGSDGVVLADGTIIPN